MKSNSEESRYVFEPSGPISDNNASSNKLLFQTFEDWARRVLDKGYKSAVVGIY